MMLLTFHTNAGSWVKGSLSQVLSLSLPATDAGLYKCGNVISGEVTVVGFPSCTPKTLQLREGAETRVACQVMVQGPQKIQLFW